jgi:two-component sensor histidine kinase/CheY-like chemotaxis protein
MLNRQICVLYIDDDPALVRLVEKALARRGYRVEHAISGEDGLARLDTADVDVIALDHHLPTGTGLDVLAALREREGAPPVVYVTASAETRVAVDTLKAGAADYVPKDIGGDFLELLGSAIDQAIEKARLQREKERAEAQVREARDRAEMLLGEVNHRVANSLALVAALVRMQASSLSDPAAREALQETQVRINAIAGIHRRLYTSDDVRFVEIDAYLQSLVGEFETAMTASGREHPLRLDAEPMRIATDKAVSVGVIVTELVTNAFKYAYPDLAQGEVRVTLSLSGAGTALLAVEDDGIGWTGDGEAKGTGLGSRIVSAMAKNLGTSVNYDASRGGTRVSLEFQV